MKKSKNFTLKSFLFCFLSLVLLTGTGTSHAKEQNLIAQWEQVLPSPNDLKGWELWYSEDQTIWIKHQNIIFIAEQTTYVSDVVFESPDGQKKTWYFRMLAYDTSGNQSDWSDIFLTEIDFEAPDKPVSFTITIKVIGS